MEDVPRIVSATTAADCRHQQQGPATRGAAIPGTPTSTG